MRIWSLDEIFRRWPYLWFRIAFEITLPVLAAIVWGVKTFVSTGTFFGAITAAGIAFTAILYVQGQLLRIAKNVRDEQHGREVLGRLDEGFDSLQQALVALRAQDLAPPKKSPEQPRVPDWVPPVLSDASKQPSQQRDVLERGSYFFGEAEEALKHGLNYAAAVLAAMGFEGKARITAEFMSIDPNRPLALLVKSLASLGYNEEILTKKFETLVRLRNLLVHSQPMALAVTAHQAKEMIAGFLEGARDLDNIEQAHL